MRRYTRLSNGFSRKLQNQAAATALNYFAYNFVKIHRTLRMSPLWPLASRIGSGTFRICSTSGSLTNGGLKEPHKTLEESNV
jgi:hypothetical protein